MSWNLSIKLNNLSNYVYSLFPTSASLIINNINTVSPGDTLNITAATIALNGATTTNSLTVGNILNIQTISVASVNVALGVVGITLSSAYASRFIVGQIVVIIGNANPLFNNVKFITTLISPPNIIYCSNPSAIPNGQTGLGGVSLSGFFDTVNINATKIVTSDATISNALTVSNAVNAGSVVSTGAISGTTITGTGAISGSTITGTGAITGASYTGTAATKMILNSTEATNGVIEYQTSGIKRGVIQYANASYPLQIMSEGGVSIDTKAGGALNLATTGGAGNINFITNSVTKASVESTGIVIGSGYSLTIGTASASSGLDIFSNKAQPLTFTNGSGTYYNNIGFDAIGGVFRIGVPGGNGVLLTYNNNVWGLYSDARLKENVVPIIGLDKILQLRPVSYNMITTPNRTNFGFIAQDVLPIIPEIVEEIHYKDDEKRYMMTPSEILPFAVKAIQEQQIQIDDLKQEFDEIKQLINSMINKAL